MKTRKKITKTPTKGRRSSILGLKKSPIVRKNLQRNVKNSMKAIGVEYDSPLNHLYKNSSAKLINSTNVLKNKEVQISTNNANNKEKESCSIKNLLSLEEKKKKNIDGNKNQQNNLYRNSTNIDSLSKSKKRTLCSTTVLDDKPHLKRKKMNENKLLTFSNSRETNQFSDSIIFIDDTQCRPETETAFNNNKTNSLYNTPNNSCKNNSPFTNNDEIVVIDGNDSSFLQTDDPNPGNKNTNSPATNSPATNSQLMDSIIIIDPDDEFSAQTQSTPQKLNEDCFVVWSSLPRNCKSNNSPNMYSSVNTNLKLSEHNKFIIHTEADYSNLRFLNNGNNNLSKKKSKKSPASKKGIKKALPKPAFNVKSKVEIKSKSPKIANKSTIKPVPKTVKKNITTKLGVKTTLTKQRTKVISSGELIFSSESKQENEMLEKTKNCNKGRLREIVIDGSNVALAYTKNKIFSEKGIKMLIDYFTKRGHIVKVFVPQYRRSKRFPLLEKWHTEGIVIFTPSRKLGKKTITPYDDRYILEYATACNGIVVSQDQFRDLYDEKPQYKDTIENRLLIPTFVGDYVMFPEDPLGRDGPTLTNFLKY